MPLITYKKDCPSCGKKALKKKVTMDHGLAGKKWLSVTSSKCYKCQSVFPSLSILVEDPK